MSSRIIRVKDKAGKKGTVIGQSYASWYIHWDGEKYGAREFGCTSKDQVEVISEEA